VASFWGDPEVAQAVEALGPHLREWATGFLLSALFSMARYRNYEMEVRRAGHDLARLLPLLEIESSALIDPLPPSLREAVEAAGPAGSPARAAARRMVEERCLSILAMRGPFFPQVVSLAALGELEAAGAVNEIIDFLGEENSYLYEAAEQALSSLGDAVVAPARARLDAGDLPEDAVHSLLLVLCELGTPEALRLVLEQFDVFVAAVGAADAARWMSIFGARELIDPLRRILPQDAAQVGQAVLLLAGIHNLHVPEENSIRRAIDDYWKSQAEGGEGGGEPGPDDGSGKYVM
jgi:HEAT repeat protein